MNYTYGTMQPAFDRKALAWSQYNQSVGGRLRQAVILHHLGVHMPRVPTDILDVGGGTGELAAALAEAGHCVTLLDFSPAMIEQARHRCVDLNVAFFCADVGQVSTRFDPKSFDLILCHSVLEFVDDPLELLGHLARLVRAGGLLSIVAGNRYHLPLRAALLERDFCRAQLGLDEEISATDLFGLPRHTFYPEDVRKMIQACDMQPIGEYGVRVFADLMGEPPTLTQDLLALELAASSRKPYCYLARFVQLIATKG